MKYNLYFRSFTATPDPEEIERNRVSDILLNQL